MSVAQRRPFAPSERHNADEDPAPPELAKRRRRELAGWRPKGKDQWGEDASDVGVIEGPFQRLTGEQQRLVEDHLHIARDIADSRRFKEKGLYEDDMVAAGFDALCRASPKFDPAIGPFENMARVYIVNAIRGLFDEEDSRAETIDPAIMAETVASGPIPRTFLSEIDHPDADRVLSEAIRDGEIDERDRMIIHALSGKTQDAVACEFGVSVSTVKRTVKRLRAVLRNRLKVA